LQLQQQNTHTGQLSTLWCPKSFFELELESHGREVVTGSGNVGEFSRLSQPSWLLGSL